jgi:hypothetical protein
MRMAWVIVVSAGLVGCINYPVLIPAPDAVHVADRPNTALAEANGVRLVVSQAHWHGVPSELPGLVTPIDVYVENHSGAPLRIRYMEFRLTGPSGFVVTAIPPHRIQRPAQQVVVPGPFYPSFGFYVAAPFAPYYPGISPWAGAWDYEPGFYDSYSYWTPALPTPDMLRRALPEGVLQNGGNVRGLLYLPRVTQQDVRFVFQVQLVNAETQQGVGMLAVPLTLE